MTKPPRSLRELREYLQQDAELTGLLQLVSLHLGEDNAHDVAHSERVALWTIRLAPGAPVRHAIAAALLHDVVNPPKNSPERARASEMSAQTASELLSRFGFEPLEIEAICEAIRTHSYSRGESPTSPLGSALQDADRLEALGALGICRALSTGARMGSHYFDADDPWAARRALDERAYTVDHFFTKLLGLADTMRTAAGRREARRRTRFLHAFLTQLGQELGASLPPGVARDSSSPDD